MSPAAALLRFVALTAPVAVLVLLGLSDFFVGWDGQAVSARPARNADPPTRTVLIVEDGGAFEREWPADLTSELVLPVDASGIPPVKLPDTLPATSKRRFTLHFLAEAPDGFRVVPTTSSTALGIAVLVWAALIALRNMIVAGAPWAIVPTERFLPAAQPPSGQVTTKGYTKPRKTHPTRSGRR